MPGLKVLSRLSFVLLSLLLMGQAQNCGKLDDTIKSLLDDKFSAQKGAKIYISNLSFMDAEARSVMVAGDAELINKAVEDGMKALASQDKKYVVNAQGHTLSNTDANAQKLSQIYWNANMDRTAKVNQIISDLMGPNNIDGLVSGQFHQKPDGSINLRPFVISKSSKNFVTESRTFTAKELNCKDPQNPNKKVICQKAHEDIKDTVIRLLKQL